VLSELINDEEFKILRRAEIIEQFYIRMNIPFLKYIICLGCKLKKPILGYEIKRAENTKL
jgi:hypothetical protein